MRYKYTREQLQEVILDSKSLAQVCRKLNIKPAGGNYKTLNSKIKEWDLDTTHFRGQGWNIGLQFKPNKPKNLCDILIKYSTYPSPKLKQRLFNEGLKNRVCELCENSVWLGSPISLELHHVNGDKYDNRLENLQILCPNCHATTDNYRGKNIGRSDETGSTCET